MRKKQSSLVFVLIVLVTIFLGLALPEYYIIIIYKTFLILGYLLDLASQIYVARNKMCLENPYFKTQKKYKEHYHYVTVEVAKFLFLFLILFPLDSKRLIPTLCASVVYLLFLIYGVYEILRNNRTHNQSFKNAR